jgi:ketosteroid isomerase-like protein
MGETIEQRLRRLEDRAAIDELIARYGFTIDDRDLPAITDLFTEDAAVRSADGVMNAKGLEAVIEQFHGRFAALGPSNHFTHDRVITFDEADPDRATGQLISHAEMTRNGRACLAAIRYTDEFRRCPDGRWRFRERVLSFLYYTHPDEYGDTLESTLRIKAYDEPIAASWPESLETWKQYYAEHPRTVTA